MANNTNNHDVFQLIWKSTYSINKETVDVIIKELQDEIRYQSTVVLPRVKSNLQKRKILKDLDLLRKQRDDLITKYDDNRNPRASGGLGGDPQSTDENYFEGDASKSIKKSISKRELFKALYGRVWGTTDGLNADKLEKMSEGDLDAHITALEKIFDK